MNLSTLIAEAREKQASDLHLEPGLPPAFRVRGKLELGPQPLGGRILLDLAREVIGEGSWPDFIARRSFDGSRVVAGARIRVNVLQTARGVGMAIRLLGATQPSLESLNLHPDLAKLVTPSHGLVLVSGPTGSGKTATLAALVEHINGRQARHVLSIEQPIEYVFRPRRAFIRQREVGRDTPSFDQALLDALREDPDVIVVGEMRDPETMRLTLAAAETGHLVLATLHASTAGEALSRLVASFPAEAQSGVRAQLAACLNAVVCQRLTWWPAAGCRVPEIELLTATDAVRNHIREGNIFKVRSAMDTGARDGMWTRPRYQRWLSERSQFHRPDARQTAPVSTFESEAIRPAGAMTPPRARSRQAPRPPAAAPATPPPADGAVVIEDDHVHIGDLIAQIERS
ncbi:MAG: PilT/PilU family type 4a pilus ATPase [Myxococcales bacterium]|nr:PilT/PilU family type 4a pilus ATPase [Myxococcales bacterium]